MRAVVEAGVGQLIRLVGEAWDGNASTFPDPRVTKLTFEARPADVSDLRIGLWITIEFEIDESELDDSTAVARELLDRVVDAVAVSAGEEVRIYYWSERVFVPGAQRVSLRPIAVDRPEVDFEIAPLISQELNEPHYRALRHLRDGLAHTSPERRFTSLMLAVVILARTLPDPPVREEKCPNCDAVLRTVGLGDGARIANLANILTGWTAERLKELWELRCAVMGHGGRALTPNVASELLEAGFDAGRLAYDCLNASLPGLNLGGPAETWFMTDLYLLLDSGDHAHEGAVDVEIKRDGDEWVASWPATERREFRAADRWAVLRAAREQAIGSMKRPPRPAEPGDPEIVRIPIYF